MTDDRRVWIAKLAVDRLMDPGSRSLALGTLQALEELEHTEKQLKQAKETIEYFGRELKDIKVLVQTYAKRSPRVAPVA